MSAGTHIKMLEANLKTLGDLYWDTWSKLTGEIRVLKESARITTKLDRTTVDTLKKFFRANAELDVLMRTNSSTVASWPKRDKDRWDKAHDALSSSQSTLMRIGELLISDPDWTPQDDDATKDGEP